MPARGSRGISLSAIRIIVLAAAALLITIGLMRDEQLFVMRKAVRICLECIGLG